MDISSSNLSTSLHGLKVVAFFSATQNIPTSYILTFHEVGIFAYVSTQMEVEISLSLRREGLKKRSSLYFLWKVGALYFVISRLRRGYQYATQAKPRQKPFHGIHCVKMTDLDYKIGGKNRVQEQLEWWKGFCRG